MTVWIQVESKKEEEFVKHVRKYVLNKIKKRELTLEEFDEKSGFLSSGTERFLLREDWTIAEAFRVLEFLNIKLIFDFIEEEVA